MPLTVTASTMQDMIAMCRLQMPQESCGFIVAERGSRTGTRVHWIKNSHEAPHRYYAMRDADVRAAYTEFDAADEEPIACFHSHPTTDAVLSSTDLRMAADESLAYVVVSFRTPVPKVRAFTVQHFIGNSEATPTRIVVEANTMRPTGVLAGPWALTPGNRVRICYQRTNAPKLSTNVARVVAIDDERVHLEPDHKTAAKSIDLGRIRSIHVLSEGAQGKAARIQLRQLATEAKVLLAGNDVMALPSLMDMLHLAFPKDVAITMDGPTR